MDLSLFSAPKFIGSYLNWDYFSCYKTPHKRINKSSYCRIWNISDQRLLFPIFYLFFVGNFFIFNFRSRSQTKKFYIYLSPTKLRLTLLLFKFHGYGDIVKKLFLNLYLSRWRSNGSTPSPGNATNTITYPKCTVAFFFDDG